MCGGGDRALKVGTGGHERAGHRPGSGLRMTPARPGDCRRRARYFGNLVTAASGVGVKAPSVFSRWSTRARVVRSLECRSNLEPLGHPGQRFRRRFLMLGEKPLTFPAAASAPVGQSHPVGLHTYLDRCHRFAVPRPLPAEAVPRHQIALALPAAHVQRPAIFHRVPLVPAIPVSATDAAHNVLQIFPKSSGNFNRR